MFERLLAPLLETLRPHFDLSKTRLETLAVLLFGLANCRTVNLSHLASQFPGDARHASNYRRLQRFFQHIRLDGDIGAQLIVGILKLGRPKLLALDRTNWKLGSRDVNVLVLAIVTRRFRVPLMWTLLPHCRQFRHRATHRAAGALSEPFRSVLHQGAAGRQGVHRCRVVEIPV
jgi:hypothetical protein